MKREKRLGATGHRAMAAIMAGLLGATGFVVPLAPATALAETHQPSVGTISARPEYRYVLLTPAEVEALYAAVPDGEPVDLSAYYCQYLKTIDDYDPAPDAADDHVGYAKFGEEYGTHAGENALYRREVVRETQTGSGTTDLTMILESSGEFGGTDEPIVVPADEPGTGHYDENGDPQDGGDYELNPYYNPDENGDNLGDNLAFTVPSSINYVVKADGRLIGPEEGAAYIENESAFAAHVSSLDVDEQSPFHIVESTMNSDATNAVELEIGPRGSLLSAYDYLDKRSVGVVEDWNMEASTDGTADQVPLLTGGMVANIAADISTTTKFGEIHWYVTPGAVEVPMGDGVPIGGIEVLPQYYTVYVNGAAHTISNSYLDVLVGLGSCSGYQWQIDNGTPETVSGDFSTLTWEDFFVAHPAAWTAVVNEQQLSITAIP